MTETMTALTTPFPLIEGWVPNRLAEFDSKVGVGQYLVYGQTGASKCVAVDYGTRIGLDEHAAEMYVASAPATSALNPAMMAFECSPSTLARPGTFHSMCVVREEMAALMAPLPVEEAPEYELDIVAGVRCQALAHTRRELFAVHSQLVSVLVQRLRAAAEGEMSRPIRLPQRQWHVLHECSHHGVQMATAECATKESVKAPVGDHPIASFYKQAEYDWTTEGYEAREALKRFSE